MLFNSYEFIFIFLPVTLCVYFFLNRRCLFQLSKAWLAASSLFFYSWWNVNYLPLILGSILINYLIGYSLVAAARENLRIVYRKCLLTVGISINIILLTFFKYTGFLLANFNFLLNTQFMMQNIVLPLGISFFTFTQISYLVDAYRGIAKEYRFLNYCLFVTYFPHLLAGPILHHSEMMPQFGDRNNKSHHFGNIAQGVFLFFLGLVKKVVIADTFATWVNSGFDNSTTLNFTEAWMTSLSYTIQIYYDFSGYTDMALGSALLFNIKLPINFNSPYKAMNIRDFWQRWHITLSRFMRDYLYIPLGGNRVGRVKTLQNIMLTFLIGGIWHGAGWMFVFWGFLHGMAMVIHYFWSRLNIRLNSILAWAITFNFVNVAWIFFRAKTWDDALKVITGMLGLNGIVLPDVLPDYFFVLKNYGIHFGKFLVNIDSGKESLIMVIVVLLITLSAKNSMAITKRLTPSLKYSILMSVMVIISILFLNRTSEFIYFRF